MGAAPRRRERSTVGDNEVVAWVRATLNGCRLLVCSSQCLERLDTAEWPEEFERVRIAIEWECAHCFVCGVLVGEPWQWCALHGLHCPDVLWDRTVTARDFAATFVGKAGRAVSDALWEVAEIESFDQPWLSGAELAARVIAP